MANVPFPITGENMDELRAQVYELIRSIYEEKIGGADLGDVFSMPGDVLTLVLDASTPGLQKVGNALAVKVGSDGGLTVTSAGVYIKAKADGGLNTDENGLFIELDGTSLTLSEHGLKVTDISSWENIQVAAAGAVYFGSSGTDGSWRIIRDGDNLVFQRRESGAWYTKDTITPA